MPIKAGLGKLKRLGRRFFLPNGAPLGPEETLQPLDEPFRSALLSMYRDEPQEGIDHAMHLVDPSLRIPASQGMWLYESSVGKAQSILEIGTCYGYSALFFLAALVKGTSGQLVSVDPFERTVWHGIALRTIEKVGASGRFRHIEERSDRAVADLAREGAFFDMIFIDGNHRFDDVLTDFYLYAQLCKKGGRIVFDDMWMPSIESVVSFVRANRSDFQEVGSGERNIAVFERVGEDSRDWRHFRAFSVATRRVGIP